MEPITLTQKQLDNLSLYRVSKEITNSEAQLYYLNGIPGINEELLLKKLFITSNETIASKIFNISLLKDKEEEIGIEELVIPQHLVSLEDEEKSKVIGITIPEVKNSVNLGVLINSSNVKLEYKKKYLYLIGNLLKKVQKMERLGIKFAFGDLHEYNFLITNEKKLKAIDIDSCYLGNNFPLPSHYLCINKNLDVAKNKYKMNQYGIVYPNKDTDLLCYNMMLLKWIAGEDLSKISIDDHNDYIKYLEDLGFGKDLIKSFRKIYSKDKNINPCDYLDQIPDDALEYSKFKTYKK